jgi:hypothetical protein
MLNELHNPLSLLIYLQGPVGRRSSDTALEETYREQPRHHRQAGRAVMRRKEKCRIDIVPS